MRTLTPKQGAGPQSAAPESGARVQTQYGQGGGLNSILHLQRTIGNLAVRRLLGADARDAGEGASSSWEPGGAESEAEQFYQSACAAAAVAGGPSLSGTVAAFNQSFNLITASAGAADNYRAPTSAGPGMLRQQGPSFSMGGRVEAPAAAVHFRLGIIQQVVQSVRRAQYVGLTTGAPLLNCDYTRGPGLDILPGSAPPWYNGPNHPREMTPSVYVSIADDPSGDFQLVVNNAGDMQPPFAGRLARLSGCDQYRTWLVIQSPAGGLQAVAWTEWAVNWDFEYNTTFSPSSAAPPTATAARHGITGWLTSAPQIGAGPPIPTRVAPATVRTCTAAAAAPAAPPRPPSPAPHATPAR